MDKNKIYIMNDMFLIEKYCNDLLNIKNNPGYLTSLELVNKGLYKFVFNLLDKEIFNPNTITNTKATNEWHWDFRPISDIDRGMIYYEYKISGNISLNDVEKYYVIEFRKLKLEKIKSKL